MSISFKKIEQILADRNMTRSDLRSDRGAGKENGIHPSVLSKIFNDGSVNTDTINRLCKLLNCQPGDIMEYVPENEK